MKQIQPNIKLLLFLIAILFFYSCSNEERKNESLNNISKYNLFNPLFIDKLINPPNNYGSVWNETNIKKLTINSVIIAVKGGKSSNDVHEKQITSFNKFGRLFKNEYYNYTISPSILDQFNYKYDQNQLKQINCYSYFGVNNLPPILVNKNAISEYFYKPKANKNNDTIFFYPNFDHAEIIIEKVGKFINHIEVIVDKNSTAKDFMNKIKSIDSTLFSFELADKMITYKENNLPIESYHIGQNWNIEELAKKWEYNDLNQPINFKEWLHGTLIKDINIDYNENYLPKKIYFNRKKYYILYKKI